MDSRLVAIFQALFVVFLWATSWVFIKIGLQDVPPITFAGLRYILAFACLLVVLASRGAAKELHGLPRRTWLNLIGLGLIYYTITQGTAFVALAYLPAVTVNLLLSFTSVVVAVMGMVWLAERPTSFQWAGMLLAVIGAGIYFLPVTVPAGQTIGMVAAVAGVLANAVSSVIGRSINRSSQLAPLVVTVVSMGAGSITLLVTGLLVEGLPGISLQSWAIVAWLAVVNTAVAFTLWNHTLRTLTAMESSIINGTMIIWIPIFAVLFLGEEITTKGVIGLAAVGLGTLIVQLRAWPLLPKRASTPGEP